MARPQITTSQRFSRAARAERDRLYKQRAQLAKRREGLQGRIDALDEELEAVDKQLLVLEDLTETSRSSVEIREVNRDAGDGPELLSGARIRAVAVPLLIEKHGFGPIHYKDWYSLLGREGYAAAGKRPDAVFLNQVSRSPLVRSTTKSGLYVLDPTAVDQLREQLRAQQSELGALLRNVPDDTASLEAHRKRSRELSSEIGRTERDLREAVLALEAAKDQAASEPPRIRAA